MNLSAQCILKNLPFSVPSAMRESAENTLTMHRPVFVDDSTEGWPNNRICLCRSIPEGLEHRPIPKDILIFCAQPIPRDQTGNLQHKCCVIPKSVSLLGLFNLLQEVFDRYDAWDDRLKASLKGRLRIRAMLDASYPIFGNPLLLQASDFFLIAHSSIINEDPDMSHLIDPGDSYDTITTSKLDPNFLDSRSHREPFYFPAYLSGCKELCLNLFQHGVFSHRLILAEVKEKITPADEPFLSYLGGYIDLVLAQSIEDSKNTTFSLDGTLTQIIEETLTDPTQIRTQLADFGWNVNHSYCCLSLKMTSLDNQSLTSHYLCHHFEEIVPGSCAFQHHDEIVAFVNLTRYEKSLDQLLNSTTTFFRDSYLKAGVSNTIHGISDLRYCYLQSKYAFSIGRKYQNYRWVHRFDTICTTYLMDCCTRDLPAHMICSGDLLKLLKYDEDHNSQYCETLRTYLETNLNAVQSSRKLFIHRSTFLYRLERIQEILSVDFEDRDTLFYLLISFHILDLNKTIDPTLPL